MGQTTKGKGRREGEARFCKQPKWGRRVRIGTITEFGWSHYCRRGEFVYLSLGTTCLTCGAGVTDAKEATNASA